MEAPMLPLLDSRDDRYILANTKILPFVAYIRIVAINDESNRRLMVDVGP